MTPPLCTCQCEVRRGRWIRTVRDRTCPQHGDPGTTWPAHFNARAAVVLRLYLATAADGPGGRPGVPDLATIDNMARTLIAELDAIESAKAARRPRT